MKQDTPNIASPPSRIPAGITFVLGLAAVGLWLASPYDRSNPDSLAVSTRLPGSFLQLCSQREAMHGLFMIDSSNEPLSISFRRLTYLGNAGYPAGHQFDILGIVVALLPHTHHGGDFIIPPYFAIVIPYWLITTLAAIGFLKCSGILARIRPYFAFSPPSRWLMAACGLAFLGANVVPRETYHQGVVRDYGFPFVHRKAAFQNGAELQDYLGYDLGWRQIKLGDNLWLCVVATMNLGLLCEFLTSPGKRKVVLRPRRIADDPHARISENRIGSHDRLP